MGAALWSLTRWGTTDTNHTWNTKRKRRRFSCAEDQVDRINGTVMMTEDDPDAQSLLKLRVEGTESVPSALLCHSVLCGASVEDVYGFHYHAYPTESPHDAHGTALCWSLRRSSLKVHTLLSLGRVANSCRKDLVFFDDDVGVRLSYRTAL